MASFALTGSRLATALVPAGTPSASSRALPRHIARSACGRVSNNAMSTVGPASRRAG